MSAPVYNLEDSIERAVMGALEDLDGNLFSQDGSTAIKLVAADDSGETELPFISVRAEKDEELTLGAGVWRVRLVACLKTAADLTDEELADQRRVPDAADDDTGAAGFNTAWRTLTDLMHAQTFKTSVNDKELCYLWGYEPQPVSYENEERTFSRSVNVILHASEAYAS